MALLSNCYQGIYLGYWFNSDGWQIIFVEGQVIHWLIQPHYFCSETGQI